MESDGSGQPGPELRHDPHRRAVEGGKGASAGRVERGGGGRGRRRVESRGAAPAGESSRPRVGATLGRARRGSRRGERTAAAPVPTNAPSPLPVICEPGATASHRPRCRAEPRPGGRPTGRDVRRRHTAQSETAKPRPNRAAGRRSHRRNLQLTSAAGETSASD